MKIKDKCLPCLVNQVIKVADITGVKDREKLYKEVFSYLSSMDFTKTSPEVIGATFSMIKKHIGNEDPYHDIRKYYNKLLMGISDEFEKKICNSDDSLAEAVRYAAIGNIIDFNPIHNNSMEDIMAFINNSDELKFSINHTSKLKDDLRKSKSLLYLGDNCGEICFDKILIKEIKKCNPDIKVYFGVRGEPVVNDSIEEDAYFVGIDKYATVISNGDNSLGTVLSRASEEFNKIYKNADIVITKGQANYESLSEEVNKNIYFFLVTKCAVIADDIGVPQKSLVCMNHNL